MILTIKGIDFFGKVCYTEIKLENKTNILTSNKITQKQKGVKYGEKTRTNRLYKLYCLANRARD